MIEQYNIISSTAAGGVPTSTAKIETPDEFAQKIENAIVHKYIESPNGRGGVMVISKDYIPAGKIIAARDAAIRSECAALLKMCGEALEQIASDDYMLSIHEIARVALAALRETGVI